MNLRDDDGGAGDLFDGHGGYQHVPLSQRRARLGVAVIGCSLVVTVIGGMLLY